jgi:hypothetical protein
MKSAIAVEIFGYPQNKRLEFLLRNLPQNISVVSPKNRGSLTVGFPPELPQNKITPHSEIPVFTKPSLEFQ